MLVLAVAHRVLVRVEALLERQSGEASVVFLGVLRTDSGPVNNRLDQAFSIHWAVCFHSTVALRRALPALSGAEGWLLLSAVVLSAADDSSHIWHATITNLQRVGVEELVKLGSLQKVFNQFHVWRVPAADSIGLYRDDGLGVLRKSHAVKLIGSGRILSRYSLTLV